MPATSLDEILEEAFGLLRGGVTDRHSPFRTLSLATADADGAPDLRIVILRAFDADARTLEVHTDARSAKATQLGGDARIALLFWDAARRLQVRLRGRASMHTADALARAAWERLPDASRELYRVRAHPGAPIDDPAAAYVDALADDAAAANFVAVEVTFTRLETLYLTDAGQIRARFEWPAGALQAGWIVP